MHSKDILEFTDQNFEAEVLKSANPVLVDFGAEWCPPCKAMLPTIEKIARDHAGKLKVGSVDTDTNREVAIKYAINSLPTVLIFKGGQVVQSFVGLRKESVFKEAIAALG